MKTINYLLMAILLATPLSAVADTGSVLIVDLDWNNGLLTYQDRIIKCGHSPDYVLAPDSGYVAELQTIDGDVLTTFTFEIPDKEYREISDPAFKTISGGRVILNETQFALVFPYYDEATHVVIYNPRKFKILEIPLVEERFAENRMSWWWLLLLAAIAGFTYYRYKKKRKDALTKTF